MGERLRVSAGPGELRPVESRAVWLTWGLALQAIGVGIPITVALRRANKDGVLGSISHYTVRLVWHELLRSRADVALIALGILVFAAGAVVMARPFVKRKSTLFTYAPLAGAVAVALLGVIALIVALVIAISAGSGDVDWGSLLTNLGSWPTGGRRRRRK